MFLLKHRRTEVRKKDKFKSETPHYDRMQQVEDKLLELIEIYGSARKDHEVFVKPTEHFNLTEELFERLKVMDMG